MLVKIDNNEKAFIQAMELAKRHLGEKTASKAALSLIVNYPESINKEHAYLDKIQSLEYKNEQLENKLEEIEEALNVIKNFSTI